ncbi:hypothetical protein [Streptomyces adustus]|uniref:hypothetical protein n=1 Tax=Streptomyces adustus TaxID=1609272 RepID=UPI00371DBBF4
MRVAFELEGVERDTVVEGEDELTCRAAGRGIDPVECHLLRQRLPDTRGELGAANSDIPS